MSGHLVATRPALGTELKVWAEVYCRCSQRMPLSVSFQEPFVHCSFSRLLFIYYVWLEFLTVLVWFMVRVVGKVLFVSLLLLLLRQGLSVA